MGLACNHDSRSALACACSRYELKTGRLGVGHVRSRPEGREEFSVLSENRFNATCNIMNHEGILMFCKRGEVMPMKAILTLMPQHPIVQRGSPQAGLLGYQPGDHPPKRRSGCGIAASYGMRKLEVGLASFHTEERVKDASCESL